jgi:hypothetical protein
LGAARLGQRQCSGTLPGGFAGPGGEAEMPVGRFPGLVVRWEAPVEIYIRDLELEVGRDCSGRQDGLRAHIYISLTRWQVRCRI